MDMTLARRTISSIAATLFAMASISGAAQADPVEEYCVVVTGKTPKDPVHTACASSAGAPELKTLSAAATPLMTWYDNWHWDGSNGVVTWYGYAGTCDAEGYVIHFDQNNFPAWKNRISSFTVHGNCWTTMAYNVAYSPFEGSARYDGNVWFVTTGWVNLNDDFEGFWVTSPR
jgi:hypothetical protein